MVIENFDPTPVLEWLLGPGYVQGMVFELIPLLALLILGAGLTGWCVSALRRESAKAASLVSDVCAIGIVAGGFGLLLLWVVDKMKPAWEVLVPIDRFFVQAFGPGWLAGGLFHWIITLLCLAFAALVMGGLFAAIRMGPRAAWRATRHLLSDALFDLAMISPRRVFALAYLAVKEAIRRRVIVVFAIFVLLILFAGWFLEGGSEHPARLYLTFVLNWTMYLVLLLALFLSALSLPEDIKNKTIHTVVTKPVRKSEVVLGRMIGFSVVGTCLLLAMGVISYMFVSRGLSHQHDLDPGDIAAARKVWERQLAEGKPLERQKLTTTRADKHRHDVYITPAPGTRNKTSLPTGGQVSTASEFDHWHLFSYDLSAAESSPEKLRFQARAQGGHKGMLIARVPIYGRLHFLDEHEQKQRRGKNVGDEWEYRSFVLGMSAEEIVWEFQGVTQANFPRAALTKGIPLELTLEAFRTHKGDTSDAKEIKGVLGRLSIEVPPEKQEELVAQGRLQPDETTVNVRIFVVRDFATDEHYIPLELTSANRSKIDLFDDLVVDGRMAVRVACRAGGQFIGAAEPDAYLRAAQASFQVNFVKGYLGIWFQMVLITGVAVMLSTFLSGPIAVLATLGVLVGGLVRPFMLKLATGEQLGGGAVEASIRLATHQNVVSEMEPGWRTEVAMWIDQVVSRGLQVTVAILPEFGTLNFADYVANGFDVSGVLLLKSLCRTIAFLLPVFLAGYFFLTTREVAK